MSAGMRHRCLNHAAREAVARCPSCKHTFCRECVTEHEGKVLCANCLRQRSTEKRSRDPRVLAFAAGALQAIAALAIASIVFYGLGTFLEDVPASFHEGTLW